MAERQRVLCSSLDSIRSESRSPGLSADAANAVTQDAFRAQAVSQREKWRVNLTRARSSRDKSREYDSNMRKCMTDITTGHDAWKRVKTELDEFIVLPSAEHPCDQQLPTNISWCDIKSSVALSKLDKLLALIHYQEKLVQDERNRHLGV